MKTKLRGWKKICAFTYVQSMKSKAMKIALAVLCIIALVSMPLISIISGSEGNDGEDGEKTSIKKVYYYDDTGIIVKQFADKKISNDVYAELEYEEKDSRDNIEEIINRDDNKNEIFLVIEYCEDKTDLDYGVNVYVYYGENSEVESEDAGEYAEFVRDKGENAILLSAGASEKEIEKLSKNVEYSIFKFDENGNMVSDDDAGISMFQYNFTLAFLCISIFMVSFVGSKVSELIVTEKSTRVMEYLLTTIKPMAILVGKVIGSTLVMLTMLGSIIISLTASVFINNIMFPSEGGGFVIPSILSELIENGALSGVTPINVILVFLLLIGGYLFYGTVAGIAGATVSKIEEMAEGMKIFTFTMCVGAYLPLFLTMANSMIGEDWGIFSKVVYLLPISSIFILPQYIIFGKVSQLMVLAALVIMMLSIVLVLIFVNKVYEHMLYSNGAVLKLKDIISMTRSGKEKRNGK